MLVDEIVKTNDIEGVYSSRREINSVLSELETKSHGKRFMGLVQKYLMLQKNETMSFDTCEDIRNLYNDLVYFEIEEDNPSDLPDGKIFRKDSTSVLSATQKELHRGVNPEGKIIECMNKALAILNDKSIECVFRISIFITSLVTFILSMTATEEHPVSSAVTCCQKNLNQLSVTECLILLKRT